MKILVIIPAYNEAKGIGDLVSQTRALGLDTLVIDDGSSDATSQIAREKGAVVLGNRQNLGKGASLRKGFEFVLKNNYFAVITMDGDGQHSPKDLPKFLDEMNNAPDATIVIGSRMKKTKGMPVIRILTNKFMSFVLSNVCSQDIPDSQCGYRLIPSEILKKANLSTYRYEMESEILIRASRLGYRIVSVPIETIYRDTKSQINPLVDTLRFLRFIFRELWTSQT